MESEKVVKVTPLELVQILKEQAYDHERFESLDEFMIWSAQSIWRFQSKGIDIQGESLEDRCDSFILQLIEHKLIPTQKIK